MLEEFFQQGDLERAQGLPLSPLMDRTTTALGPSQINFIEFVVAPLFLQANSLFRQLSHRPERRHIAPAPCIGLHESGHGALVLCRQLSHVRVPCEHSPPQPSTFKTRHAPSDKVQGQHSCLRRLRQSIQWCNGAAGRQSVPGAEGNGAVPV